MAMEKVWLRGREKEGSELSKSRGALEAMNVGDRG